MPDAPTPRPEAPTATIRTHEDYRRAYERIGQLEGVRPSRVRDLELQTLRAAVHAYEPRQMQRF